MIKRLKQWIHGGAGPQTAGEGAELRVLMVCMGNICRSPTAEGVLRDRLQRAGLQQRVAVDSAGTLDHHAGEPPDPRAQRHAALRGYDLSSQRARAVRAEDFSRFHWLLAMDEDNLAWLQRRAPPGSTARIELLMPYARRFAEVQAVPDPYYGNAAGFERVLDLVEDACDGLVARLQQELGARPGL
jgi:protein-tyrosine phosphatase